MPDLVIIILLACLIGPLMVYIANRKASFEEITPVEQKMYLWGVIDGPYLIEDFPEEELDYMNIPYEAEVMLVCKVSIGDEVSHVNMWYPSLDEAYQTVKYFDKHLEPLEVML